MSDEQQPASSRTSYLAGIRERVRRLRDEITISVQEALRSCVYPTAPVTRPNPFFNLDQTAERFIPPPADRPAYVQAAAPPADPPASSNPSEPASQLSPERLRWRISMPPEGLMNSPLITRATDLSRGEHQLFNREALAQQQSSALAEMQRYAAAQQARAAAQQAEPISPVAAGAASLRDDASDSAAYASVSASLASLAHTTGYVIADPEALIRLRDRGLLSDATARRQLESYGSHDESDVVASDDSSIDADEASVGLTAQQWLDRHGGSVTIRPAEPDSPPARSIPFGTLPTSMYFRSSSEHAPRRHQHGPECEPGRYLCCLHIDDRELMRMPSWPSGFRVEAAGTDHRNRVELRYYDMLIEILDIYVEDMITSSFVRWCNTSPANWIHARARCGRQPSTLAFNLDHQRSTVLDRPTLNPHYSPPAAVSPPRPGQRVVTLIDSDDEVQDS